MTFGNEVNVSDLKKTLKEKKIEYILESKEYKSILNDITNNIIKLTGEAANEASTVSAFEIEVYSFINEVLDLKFHPEKEAPIETVRHTTKGRIDSKYGYLIIEFKHHSKLSTEKQITKATTQLCEYLEGLYAKEQIDYLGVITDGQKIRFVRLEGGILQIEQIKVLESIDVDRLVRMIIQLDKVALTPKNLVNTFSLRDDNVSVKLSKKLFKNIRSIEASRTAALFSEWKELFKLSHDDKSKQKAIQERRESLETAFGLKLDNGVQDEYMAMFSLQTTYSMLVKIIAFKVLSRVYFDKELISFETLALADDNALKVKMQALEDGEIFRDLGLLNLLEGDFFAWYSLDEQWDSEMAEIIRQVFGILSKYENKPIFNKAHEIQDLFRELYMSIIPEKVRSSLGEFYTPFWLADSVINDSLKHTSVDKWKGLDPCAGSGTFILCMIAKILEQFGEITEENKSAALHEVLNRVYAIDLNPIAVLTARVNYFIAISHLISKGDRFEIPVFLGDSSYVPDIVDIEGVECITYKLNTLKVELDLTVPLTMVENHDTFSQAIEQIELYIELGDTEGILNEFMSLIKDDEKTEFVITKLRELSENLVFLEKEHWNGIWARIIKNYLITAVIGDFDIIVGNPPWVDWKNLPLVYRERIKTTVCVDNHLFSGANRTGGINLNICALIANVVFNKWLSSSGTLAFLMPKTLIHQSSYEGFRNFHLVDGNRAYLQELTDWTKSGHPFKPVQEKFLTYVYNREVREYSEGIQVKKYIIKKRKKLIDAIHLTSFSDIEEWFETEMLYAGTIHHGSTTLGYAHNVDELKGFQLISGISEYKGREGIEFYPQELFLLEYLDDMESADGTIYVKNFQSDKSKHKVPQRTILMETKYLHPLVKGKEIKKFGYDSSNFIVPFPYENMQKIPIALSELSKKENSPLLAKYLMKNKEVITNQTDYNERIINNNKAEFYALARVGTYSYGEYAVAFRDNTKWQACVLGKVETAWGESVKPHFQNHAVTITQDLDENFISLEEAHYICSIMNAPIVYEYMMNSSDSRSFKIRPPFKIPKFCEDNPIHVELSKLSQEAHENSNNDEMVERILNKINKLYLSLC
jgi:hypothetical protein